MNSSSRALTCPGTVWPEARPGTFCGCSRSQGDKRVESAAAQESGVKPVTQLAQRDCGGEHRSQLGLEIREIRQCPVGARDGLPVLVPPVVMLAQTELPVRCA